MLRAFSNDTSSHDSDEEPPPVQNRNLAVGTRKSVYFARRFSEGGKFAENKDATSRIELEELAAQSFPIILDYLYSEGDKLALNTNNGTALHSMAKYFDMRYLKWEGKEFWQKDIECAGTCSIYYEHASILNNDKILDAALKTSCSERILSITKTSRLIQVPDPEVWLKILQNIKDHPGSGGRLEEVAHHASILIAEFIRQNPGLEADKFQQLTDENLLPLIHVDAAVPLLDAERMIVAAAPDEGRLLDFQERCIAALIQD